MSKITFNHTLSFSEFPPVSLEEWERRIRKDLKGANYKETLRWVSGEGVQPLPFYRREHNDELIHTSTPLYDKAQWTVIEKIDLTQISEANQQALQALENGASGLEFDLPPESITSREGLEELLKDIKIELIGLYFAPQLSTAEMLSWLQEICESRELNTDALSIFFQYDALAQSLRSGKLPSSSELSELYASLVSPFSSFSVDAALYANSGATIVQQLAIALAAGNELLGQAEKLDLSIPQMANSITFRFATGPLYFLEIAKYRAFRLCWDQVVTAYESTSKVPHRLNIKADTARWNQAQADAHNNMLRATTEAMSAALGGCQAVTVARFNEQYAEHSAFAARIARNIQIILQEEAYLDKVSDPAAGSYYVEKLTDSIAQQGWKLFQRIETKGGLYTSVKDGFIQDEIRASKNEKIESYNQQQSVLVGINKYHPPENQQETGGNPADQSIPKIAYKESHEVTQLPELNIEAEIETGVQQ
ncbi:MAG: hypothetical protein FH748_06815 [Balneolaceae bacterium]|nr:hypothetical protein [Balneolaceae bacterium]